MSTCHQLLLWVFIQLRDYVSLNTAESRHTLYFSGDFFFYKCWFKRLLLNNKHLLGAVWAGEHEQAQFCHHCPPKHTHTHTHTLSLEFTAVTQWLYSLQGQYKVAWYTWTSVQFIWITGSANTAILRGNEWHKNSQMRHASFTCNIHAQRDCSREEARLYTHSSYTVKTGPYL